MLSLPATFSALAQSSPFGYELDGKLQNTDRLLCLEDGILLSHRSYVDPDFEFFDDLVLGVDRSETIESIVAMKGYSVSVNNVGVMKREIKITL